MYCIVYHILEGEGKFSFWSPDQTFFIFYLQILARLYPCSDCAEDMRSDLAESPPRVTSASEFSLWLCQLHNKVNIKLGEFSAFTNIFWQQLFFNICPIQENRSSTAAKYFSAGETGGMMAPVTDFWPLEHCCSYCLIIIVQPSLKLDQKCLLFHYKIKSAGVFSVLSSTSLPFVPICLHGWLREGLEEEEKVKLLDSTLRGKKNQGFSPSEPNICVWLTDRTVHCTMYILVDYVLCVPYLHNM